MTEQTLAAIEHTRGEREPSPRSGRCVFCSAAPEGHNNGKCRVSGNTTYSTMSLPGELTCADCHHVERCCLLFGQLPEDQSCQFHPVRFAPAVRKPCGVL